MEKLGPMLESIRNKFREFSVASLSLALSKLT